MTSRLQPLWVNVLRIYKEALTNVIKHAHARSVAVIARHRDRCPERSNDGADGKNRNGRGWRICGSAQDINVTLTTGNGTRMSLEVPYP
jgi:glucose-6-phosphate-specific signal transduction histidine kinase